MNTRKEEVLKNVEDITGMVQSQIRTGLREFGKEAVASIQASRTPEIGIVKSPEVKSESVQFDAKPLFSQTQRSGDIPAGETSSTVPDVILAINGTGFYTNIKTDGRLDPV